ncbi:MAG: PleD family two-component system response regulator [Inquilinus sp.]|nr:PleD family two-component system response regulator [Inquilinus sp.]
MSARVLVVDDVLPNVKLLEAKLCHEYFDVLTASNGFQALERAEQEAPDLILLDVMMPGMDGFEVCKRLKASETTRHIPVVMVTALSDTADRVRGLEAGADDFLTKPVDDIALFARVRSLVRLKMMMDEWRQRENTSGELGVITKTASEQAESAEQCRILVVDDSDIELEKIVNTLEDHCEELTAVETCREALERAQAGDYELVVVSLSMQSEDALRLCSQLRSHEATRQTPILLMASEGELPRIAKGLELGANDYLLRPLDRNELKARVRTQVRRKRYQERLRQNYEESLSMALTDSLTGLFNRRYLNAHLTRIVGRIGETHKPVAAILFDVDFFKAINDTYGHAVGDEVLKELAARVSRNLRNFDMVARIGGEEFVIIMPDASVEAAAMVAERLRLTICQRPFKVSHAKGPLSIAISLGVAATENPKEPPDSLIDRADQCLYSAKNRGRNRVVAEGLDELPPDILAAVAAMG